MKIIVILMARICIWVQRPLIQPGVLTYVRLSHRLLAMRLTGFVLGILALLILKY